MTNGIGPSCEEQKDISEVVEKVVTEVVAELKNIRWVIKRSWAISLQTTTVLPQLFSMAAFIDC